MAAWVGQPSIEPFHSNFISLQFALIGFGTLIFLGDRHGAGKHNWDITGLQWMDYDKVSSRPSNTQPRNTTEDDLVQQRIRTELHHRHNPHQSLHSNPLPPCLCSLQNPENMHIHQHSSERHVLHSWLFLRPVPVCSAASNMGRHDRGFSLYQ